MLIKSAALAAACLLGALALRPQGTTTTPTVGATAGGKVGVINIRGAIGSTAEGKLAQAELQSKYAPRQNEIDNLNKQINDVRQRLAACEGKCSQEEIQRLQTQGQRLASQVDRKNNELQEDSNADLGDIINRIGTKMVDVLDRYARENGYSLILDSSAQNTPVLYVSTQNDVTQDIIRLYDQAYPVKTSGTTTTPAKPPAPKPATPTPTPTKPQR
jgi:outer membrane protein